MGFAPKNDAHNRARNDLRYVAHATALTVCRCFQFLAAGRVELL